MKKLLCVSLLACVWSSIYAESMDPPVAYVVANQSKEKLNITISQDGCRDDWYTTIAAGGNATYHIDRHYTTSNNASCAGVGNTVQHWLIYNGDNPNQYIEYVLPVGPSYQEIRVNYTTGKALTISDSVQVTNNKGGG